MKAQACREIDLLTVGVRNEVAHTCGSPNCGTFLPNGERREGMAGVIVCGWQGEWYGDMGGGWIAWVRVRHDGITFCDTMQKVRY